MDDVQSGRFGRQIPLSRFRVPINTQRDIVATVGPTVCSSQVGLRQCRVILRRMATLFSHT